MDTAGRRWLLIPPTPVGCRQAMARGRSGWSAGPSCSAILGHKPSRASCAMSSAEQTVEKRGKAGTPGNSASEEKCRSVFQLFDRSSGFMLTKDLGSALRALGQIPSDQEFDMMASKLEQDDIYDKGHTKVSFDEFYRVVQENSERKDDIREMVLDSFKCLDPQASGQVDAARLQSLLTGMGEPLSQAEAKELLQEAGLSKDGRVDYARFVEQLLQFEAAAAGGREATAAAVTEERKENKKKKKKKKKG